MNFCLLLLPLFIKKAATGTWSNHTDFTLILKLDLQEPLCITLLIFCIKFISVVYEHRARLERSLQKEKTEHKNTKLGWCLMLNYHLCSGTQLTWALMGDKNIAIFFGGDLS